MMKFVRSEPPKCLEEGRWLKWGTSYALRKAINPSLQFQWTQYEKQSTASLIGEKLLALTKHHCNFCDGAPMQSMVPTTIEHFKPKSKYPLEAYLWENLFIACGNCQKKGETYNTKLLKPDAPEYDFHLYFIYNALTGDIEPNPGADWDMQERAIETIFLYRLNDDGRPETRKKMQRVWGKALIENNAELDECPYRFMFL